MKNGETAPYEYFHPWDKEIEICHECEDRVISHGEDKCLWKSGVANG